MYILYVGENEKSAIILETIKRNRKILKNVLISVKKPSKIEKMKNKLQILPCLYSDDGIITDMSDIYDSIFEELDEPVIEEEEPQKKYIHYQEEYVDEKPAAKKSKPASNSSIDDLRNKLKAAPPHSNDDLEDITMMNGLLQ
jgi:hypothetical protein